MEFDKSKVYTVLNADEVEVGSKGYFADDLKKLKNLVEQEDKSGWDEIESIGGEDEVSRFRAYTYWNLFYLVEEPKEKKFRPYKDTEELLSNYTAGTPLVWVRRKDDEKERSLIVEYSEHTVLIGAAYYSMEELFDEFVFLDGSPCGIKEAAE